MSAFAKGKSETPPQALAAPDHAIHSLSALAHAPEPLQEFALGTPRRSVPLLKSPDDSRFTVVQRDLHHATVYYLCDSTYNEIYRSHHKGLAPGPDNVSFTLYDRGLILVKVGSNSRSSEPLSLEKGTALITPSHRAALEESVKHGLSTLRGLTEGTIQRGLHERRERLLEGRLALGYEEQLPAHRTQPDCTIRIEQFTRGPSLRRETHEIHVTTISAGLEAVHLVKPDVFNELFTSTHRNFVIETQTPGGGEVRLINEDSLPDALPELRALLLFKEPTAAKLGLFRALEQRVLTGLTEDERGRLGHKAFEILTATLERHRTEPLSDQRLVAAFRDTCSASALDTRDAIRIIGEAIEIFQLVDKSFGKGVASALQTVSLSSSAIASPLNHKAHRNALRQQSSSRTPAPSPEERVAVAKESLFRIARTAATPLALLCEHVNRVGLDAKSSSAFEHEIREHAPAGIEIPSSCKATTTIMRQSPDPRGPYLHTEFDLFEASLVLRGGTSVRGFIQVRWHTPTQTNELELPGYRVTLRIGSDTYELTSIQVTTDLKSLQDGELFVSSVDGKRNLCRMDKGTPTVLGPLTKFGLLETQDGQVYSRSLHKAGDEVQPYWVPVNNFGRDNIGQPMENMLKQVWHLPYIPKRMDIS